MPRKAYKNQTYLTIRLHLGRDLSEASSVLIRYRDPNGNEGEWTGTIEDVEKGVVSRVLQEEPLGISGKWSFWAFVTFSDGRSAPSAPFSSYVYDEGS